MKIFLLDNVDLRKTKIVFFQSFLKFAIVAV